jgi:hypothetical protein
MINVHVYPDTNSGHISHIYAGLNDLAAQGSIQLKFTCNVSKEIKQSFSYATLWIQIANLENQNSKKICFDMHDSREISSIERLKLCDIYFKRSFDKQYVAQVCRNDLAKKVMPFGLYYGCSANYYNYHVNQKLIFILANYRLYNRPIRLIKFVLTELIQSILIKNNVRLVKIGKVRIRDFESKPEEPAEPLILFQTRVWRPKGHSKKKVNFLNQLNDMRANTIRALKNNFGENFVGGLANTDFAKENYPDCLAVEKTSKRHYINLVKRCLICVTTTGLHNSIGASLPEYLAASRCIITEPLKFELPIPLQEERNFISFRSPEECVAACKKILNDLNFARQMRKENWKYYIDEVRPPNRIYKSLIAALNSK